MASWRRGCMSPMLARRPAVILPVARRDHGSNQRYSQRRCRTRKTHNAERVHDGFIGAGT